MKKKKVKNSKGNIYYGLHIYPGVAEYHPEGEKSYRVLLNESTLRKMDKSFAGRPYFVLHVDEIEERVDKLRNEADGWVIESFYNPVDGNHWTKFISVTERSESRIKAGWTLSNCYIPTKLGPGGIANGVSYQKEILEGEYEHLALVPDARYEQSVILTPEQFKKYNEDCEIELKRVANSANKKKGKPMFPKLFNRTPLKNAQELAKTHVLLEKSGRELSLETLVKEADMREVRKLKNAADPQSFVKVDGKIMTVEQLVKRYLNAKACNETEGEDLMENESDDEEDEEDDESIDNESDEEEGEEDDEGARREALKLAKDKEAKKKNKSKKKNSIEADEEEFDDEEDDEIEIPSYSAKKSNSKKKQKSRKEIMEDRRKQLNRETNKRLKNAANRGGEPEGEETVDLEVDQLARGKARYGSNSK